MQHAIRRVFDIKYYIVKGDANFFTVNNIFHLFLPPEHLKNNNVGVRSVISS